MASCRDWQRRSRRAPGAVDDPGTALELMEMIRQATVLCEAARQYGRRGDATTPEKIEAMFDETGVDAVMVGRGAIGNPWIFRDAKVYRETGEMPPPPSWEERMAVVAEHLTLKCEWLGEKKGVLEMRRMYGGYFKGFRHASRLRQLIIELPTKAAIIETLLNFSENTPGFQIAAPSRRPAALSKALLAKLPRGRF